jgi:Uma2 family endonuclease
MAETQTQTTTPPAHGAEDVERGGPATVDDGPVRAEPLLDTPRADEDLRFPGCRRIPLLRDRLTDYDGRLEYWEGRSETAWVLAEPTGGVHEGTSRRLPHLVERIAMMRGAPIASFGSVDLLVRDASGQPARMMQADETLYLHPRRALTPEGSLVIGEHELPDVVLEVDHTTDVRPGKLLLYEAWGFPELWVVVPPAGATRRRPAGVTIHRLANGRYRSVRTSGAFPGWTAREIHAALTEPVSSAATYRVLERVGRTLGEREGTGPDDDPLWRVLGERKLAEGVAKGRAEGRAAELAATVKSLLQARGKRVSDAFESSAQALVDTPRDAVTAAALAARDEEDFWRRLGAP